MPAPSSFPTTLRTRSSTPGVIDSDSSPSSTTTRSSANTTATTSTTTTATSTIAVATDKEESFRNSSETTIFSIYSMYGDDHSRSSFTANGSVDVDNNALANANARPDSTIAAKTKTKRMSVIQNGGGEGERRYSLGVGEDTVKTNGNGIPNGVRRSTAPNAVGVGVASRTTTPSSFTNGDAQQAARHSQSSNRQSMPNPLSSSSSSFAAPRTSIASTTTTGTGEPAFRNSYSAGGGAKRPLSSMMMKPSTSQQPQQEANYSTPVGANAGTETSLGYYNEGSTRPVSVATSYASAKSGAVDSGEEYQQQPRSKRGSVVVAAHAQRAPGTGSATASRTHTPTQSRSSSRQGYRHSKHLQQSPDMSSGDAERGERQLPAIPPTPPAIDDHNYNLATTSTTPTTSPPLLGVGDGLLHANTTITTPPTSSTPRFTSPLLDSPSSKVSLVPSEGEESDSFHVRHTYAVLDVCGVKGDGYEEGVERTRAKIGTSRRSQLNAQEALGDETEKSRELSQKEVQVLASLDRYGFFTIPTHDRLVLLPSAPLLKKLSPVKAGPASSSSHAQSLSSLPPTTTPPKESARIAKWNRMLTPLRRDSGGNVELWGVKPSKERKLRARTYKGIPDRWRRAAWDLFVEMYARGEKGETERLGREYREALEKPSSYDVQIDLDVPRTISGHVMFRTRYGAGQRSLFHVLHSFSQRCESCGYVQGMGPIAATLLCYLEPERVYASLVRLHHAYSLHTIFNPGFPGLLEAIYVQERIMETMMPDVYESFKRNMISTTSYATKWYITLFANSVPFQTQLRLWDAFLLDGPDVFVGVAVGIVWVYRDHITASSANFETVLSLLSSFFIPEDEDAFLGWIEKTLGDKKLRERMERWRVEWRGLVKEGKDGSALL